MNVSNSNSVRSSENNVEKAMLRGEMRWIAAEEEHRLRPNLEAARFAIARVVPAPSDRGRLPLLVDDSVEQVLLQLRTSARGVLESVDLNGALADQLFRLKQAGFGGLALFVDSLYPLALEGMYLDLSDSMAIKTLIDATRDCALILFLRKGDESLGVLDLPKSLSACVSTAQFKSGREGVNRRVTSGLSAQTMQPHHSIPLVKKESSHAQTPTPLQIHSGRPVSASRSFQRVVTSDEASTTMQARRELQEMMQFIRDVRRTMPLSSMERVFVQAYLPLRTFLLEGEPQGAQNTRTEIKSLLVQFENIFARSYAEAFPTYAATGRHPLLVADAFDWLQRAARVHGARNTHLLIVDALRYDIALALNERLAIQLSSCASCVEQETLWSVLPTTTAAQLDALTRGIDALRAPRFSDREHLIMRGRSLGMIRRVRLGHRDASKLDLIEGRLREHGPNELERIQGLADEIAPTIAGFLASLQPRTIVAVIGDHGFVWPHSSEADIRTDSTGPAQQGGPSPLEALVPCSAWLIQENVEEQE